MVAISAGKRARKAKNATPAPMIGMLSALFSAQARLTICTQPRAGMWVGFSAWTPGSSRSLGMSGAGRSASRRAVSTAVAVVAPVRGTGSAARSATALAAARRSAFSCTRCWIRSTALCGRLVSGIGPRLRMGVSVGRRSVAGPGAGQLGEPAGAGSAHGGLDHGDDGPPDGGGEQHLAQPVLALHGRRRVVRVRDLLPDQLEQCGSHRTGQEAADQPDRTVGDLGALAHRLFLQTAMPMTRASRAAVALRTTGGLSR